jgi:alcohol dehydrogenase class IV
LVFFTPEELIVAIITYLTQIQFDFGAVSLVQQECNRLGITKPLIVTDAGVKAAGLLDRVRTHLTQGEAAVFEETPSNPTEKAVRAATDLYRAKGCNGVIAVGGGSAIDLGKGVALSATHPGPLRTYAAIEGGAARITAAVAPVIAIPTTAGTGSEVGRGALLIMDDGRKLGLLSPNLLPKSAICDPELTLGLPPLLTAATGMDAIAHCMETFMSAAFNPPADGIALDGLWRGWAHIARATASPGDREARLNMMSAAMQGAMAFQKGLGCVHSLSHSLGGVNPRLHHGTLNAVFLPAVIEFNQSAPSMQRDQRLARMAQAMSLDGPQAVAPAVRQMNRHLGLPSGLRALGVTEAMFPEIIAGAMRDHCHRTNPREATAEDYAGLLAASM